MFVLFLETRVGFEEVVETLKAKCGPGVVVLRPELCFSAKFLRYTLFLAYKSFQNGGASARSLGLEWLCRIAGTGNVSSALEFCLPPKEKGTLVGIASAREIPAAVFGPLGDAVKPDPKKLGKEAAARFKVSPAALERNSLEDLLVERSALASVA
jgi:tRNA threonylcarbamoyladenosine modification (KEOPS) complex Cgi121 subunit